MNTLNSFKELMAATLECPLSQAVSIVRIAFGKAEVALENLRRFEPCSSKASWYVADRQRAYEVYEWALGEASKISEALKERQRKFENNRLENLASKLGWEPVYQYDRCKALRNGEGIQFKVEFHDDPIVVVELCYGKWIGSGAGTEVLAGTLRIPEGMRALEVVVGQGSHGERLQFMANDAHELSCFVTKSAWACGWDTYTSWVLHIFN